MQTRFSPRSRRRERFPTRVLARTRSHSLKTTANIGYKYKERRIDDENRFVIVLEHPVTSAAATTTTTSSKTETQSDTKTNTTVEQQKFVLLNTLEFSSDRKRMSVIVMDENKDIWLFCKGADSIMETLFAEGKGSTPTSIAHINAFAKEGLRTLMVGQKKLNHSDYDSWSKRWDAAAVTLVGRDEKLVQLSAEIEKDLSFVGVTAVEDRLQDHVPETIFRLKEAGIRVWVLTGDKLETAVDISYSCGLFHDNMTIHTIQDAQEMSSAMTQLQNALDAMSSSDPDVQHGFVIDGMSLIYCLDNKKAEDLLLKISLGCVACCCCRLAPKQKSKMITAVREEIPHVVTAAVGDGANDVAMIQTAHVGIGIRGVEGTQAVQASDFAISAVLLLGAAVAGARQDGLSPRFRVHPVLFLQEYCGGVFRLHLGEFQRLFRCDHVPRVLNNRLQHVIHFVCVYH